MLRGLSEGSPSENSRRRPRVGESSKEVTIPPEVHPTEPVKQPGRRTKIKWPKANDRAEWQRLDSNLSLLVELSVHGGVESKLNIFGEIIFEECRERLGEVIRRERTAPRKGRREKDIEQLVRDRRQLRQNWRKAAQDAKEALKELWDTLRQKLAKLRRVEMIRRRRKKREKERTSFFKDPFKDARQLLDEKRSGKLDTTKEELELEQWVPAHDPAVAPMAPVEVQQAKQQETTSHQYNIH